MGLFRPYQRNEVADKAQGTVAPAPATVSSSPSSAGKGTPTPSRRQAEQERLARLHPTLSKRELKQREREASRARSDREWAQVESLPERVLLRNFVDSRWSISEFTWPVLMVMMAAFLTSQWWPAMSYYSSYAIWVLMVVIIIEVGWTWSKYRKLLDERLPRASRKGLLMYMGSRMISMRRFRRPPAEIPRGGEY
ncbi:hypothetical protein GCM10009785_18630 [Brooklawnia cerclae]|uniref:Magnesium-transporting ATPase (P-type) n=1 Tax=Brooklawnia cerclae TaxID=349934 RepID=A0ABX0SGV0_9ACTN|nr:magnesium-transporting ATPase (P-type) [Brooklawnia cerclae]